jgi:hypothetical protein
MFQRGKCSNVNISTYTYIYTKCVILTNQVDRHHQNVSRGRKPEYPLINVSLNGFKTDYPRAFIKTQYPFLVLSFSMLVVSKSSGGRPPPHQYPCSLVTLCILQNAARTIRKSVESSAILTHDFSSTKLPTKSLMYSGSWIRWTSV